MSEAVSNRLEMKIAVFAKGTRTNGVPAYRTDEESAAYLVNVLRIARWVNWKYNSILMLVEPSQTRLRDASCAMGPKVTLAAVMGSRHHQALVAGWRPQARTQAAAAAKQSTPEAA
jgi:hypothetical protein